MACQVGRRHADAKSALPKEQHLEQREGIDARLGQGTMLIERYSIGHKVRPRELAKLPGNVLRIHWHGHRAAVAGREWLSLMVTVCHYCRAFEEGQARSHVKGRNWHSHQPGARTFLSAATIDGQNAAPSTRAPGVPGFEADKNVCTPVEGRSAFPSNPWPVVYGQWSLFPLWKRRPEASGYSG